MSGMGAFLAAAHRAKTDRVDSAGLARFGLAVPLHPYPVKTPRVQEVEALRRARRGLSKARAQLRQQARALPSAAPLLTPAIAALKTQVKPVDAALPDRLPRTPS